ncbi:MAG: ROK family transcriptional regulator [Pontiellaceae bacterium]|nr:ROK family transcriptional regulator [Pontiellaceae bacterium]
MTSGHTKYPFGQPRIVRQINLQTVTRQMRQMELFSKIDLARELGISTTTMTKLFAQLEEEGLIARSPVEDTSFGRPKILYQLAPELQVATIVIDLQETSICFSDLQGNAKPEHTVKLPTGVNVDDLFVRIKREFITLKTRLNASCSIVGVCIPGLIESQTGQSMLNPNLHWLEGVRPAERISEALGIDTFVMHEERALSRAQLRTPDATSNYISMDFSAGVGMSVVVNGRHLSGSSGYAGEIGHIIMQPGGKQCGCGNRGCLETVASDRVFFSELDLPPTAALELLANRNPRAVKIAENVLEWQAKGVAAAINIFNPDRVFIYSRLAHVCPYYIEDLRKEVERWTIGLLFDNCRIRTTREGKLTGALLLTIDRLMENKTRNAE